jgi:hypothetical protein
VKLIWHIGPHKTGTTSLQTGLAARAASGRASYYYPPTPEYGPGHAVLAWQFLGLNGRERTPGVILDQVERAESQGHSKMVLSSEEFSRALLTADSFSQFGDVCAKVECELVITLRPLPSRIYPELQELIKNGQRLNLADAREVLEAIMTRPGLRPDFLSAALTQTGASAISIVLVDNDLPEKAFNGMSAVLGEQLPIPRSPAMNLSYPFIQAAWLDIVNRYAGVPLDQSRAIADVAFQAAVQKVRSLADVPYPPLPPSVQRYADAVWALQLAYVHELQVAGRIRCI